MTTQNEVGTAPKICFVSSLTEQSTSDLEGVGTTRVDQYGNCYRWLKNAGAVAARAGGPCCYDSTNLAASDFLQEGLPVAVTAADVDFLAGIWMAAVAASSYGWVLTNGIYATARFAGAETGTTAGSVSAAVNDILVAATATGTTGTNTSRAFSFISNLLGATIVGTGQAGTLTLTNAFHPVVRVLSSGTPVGSGTTASPLNVMVKGLI